MVRRLSAENQLELERLYRIVSTIAQWYDAAASTHLSGVSMADTMRRAYEEHNLAGLRVAYNDLVEMTNAVTGEQRRQLAALLRQQANTTLEALSARQTERIQRIRARGKLTSEEQYYLVREHTEFIFHESGRQEELQQLLSMIHEYEDRVAARAQAPRSEIQPPNDN